jgi:phospholipid N-methyltransferase
MYSTQEQQIPSQIQFHSDYVILSTPISVFHSAQSKQITCNFPCNSFPMTNRTRNLETDYQTVKARRTLNAARLSQIYYTKTSVQLLNKQSNKFLTKTSSSILVSPVAG